MGCWLRISAAVRANSNQSSGLITARTGISQATYFNWKKKYDGLLPDEMRRLKLLEDENANLRKVVADLSLDKAMLQDALRRKL